MKRYISIMLIVFMFLTTTLGSMSVFADTTEQTSKLPTVYQTYEEVIKKYPKTRDQLGHGTGWAFAITACAEFDLVKQGAYTKEQADFSELQLIYALYNNGKDPLGLTHGDTVTYLHPFQSMLDSGGSATFTINSLSNGKGMTFEKNLPYDLADKAIKTGFDSSIVCKNDAAQLYNSYLVNIHEDRNRVKAAIMEHGAVYASFEMPAIISDEYNEQYNTYCSTKEEEYYSHSIAIVGWDDNIPKEHFNKEHRPSCDGAWLVRNSMSSENGFNLNSYFYMSYDMPTLDNCKVLDFEIDKYKHRYQHDGSPVVDFPWVESVANVFTMDNVNNTNSQSLDAVMIHALTALDTDKTKLKIQIYTGVDDPNNPKSGYLNRDATTYYTLHGEGGIFTIPLKKPVILAPREKYAIVITPVDHRAFNIGVECEETYYVDHDDYGNRTPWFKTTIGINRKESYSYNEGGWTDSVDEYKNNECYPRGNYSIKGLVNDSSKKKYLISYEMNGGNNPNTNPSGYMTGQTIELKSPKREGYTFLGWYKDKAFKERFTKIPSTSKGNVTVYAKWKLNAKVSIKNSSSSGKPIISWNKIPGMKAYEVYRSTNKTGKFEKVYTTKKYKFTDTKASPGKKYYYKIKAISTSGTIGYSSIKAITCKCKTPKVTLKNVASSGKPKLTWSKITGASKYKIYRSSSKGGKYKYIATTTDKTSYIDKSAKAGNKYYYKVKAYSKLSSNGNSAYSKIREITCDCARPKVSIKLSSNGKPKLTWKKVSGATKYEIYRAIDKDSSYCKIGTTKKCTFTNTRAKGGMKHYYKVRAVSDKSKYSKSVYSKSVYIKLK